MGTFEIVQRRQQPTAVIHETVSMKELPQFFARAFHDTLDAVRAQGLAPMGPPFAKYFGLPGDRIEVEAGFPVPRTISDAGDVHPGTLPGGRCAHAVHIGRYDELPRTYGELQRWMTTQHLAPRAELVEIYLSDPQRDPDPSSWRTEIVWPVD